MDYAEMVREAAKRQNRTQAQMDIDLFLPWNCDEVALLFDNDSHLDDFIGWADAHEDIEHFNSIPEDRMQCLQWGGVHVAEDFAAFKVRFEFLRLAGQNWRIEAMSKQGTAPLHDLALRRHGPGHVIHGSFKCSNEFEYDQAKKRLSESLTMNAEYMNSYGKFSYWGCGLNFYLKPRVNLRDFPDAPTV